jgi:DNA replicative helicase MCM subunit Mcm2 (Cdc46/Mcm family)
LTTNRVKSFDPAFHSRISIALKYRDLTEDAREQIWKNFLELAKISSPDIDAKELAKYDINGRQIKTTVRLAQALAAAEKTSVTKEHLTRTLNVTEQFKRDMLKVSQGDHW